MKRIIFLLFFVFFWGCSTYETKEAKIEKLPSAESNASEQTVERKEAPQEAPLRKESIPGSPMGLAVHSIKKAEEDMSQTIKLVEELRKGDQILDFRNNRTSSFQSLRTFFGSSCFSYDDYHFWFLTEGDKKIGIWEEDGALEKGTMGLFMSFKRLIVVQTKGHQKTETEFYVDSTKKELMVHRFHKDKTTNENYILLGK